MARETESHRHPRCCCCGCPFWAAALLANLSGWFLSWILCAVGLPIAAAVLLGNISAWMLTVLAASSSKEQKTIKVTEMPTSKQSADGALLAPIPAAKVGSRKASSRMVDTIYILQTGECYHNKKEGCPGYNSTKMQPEPRRPCGHCYRTN